MSTTAPCPRCKANALHRSRSRNIIEKVRKKVLPFGLYRCHECQWRGWIVKRNAAGQTTILRISLFYFGIMILSFVIACLLWSVIH